MLRAFLLRFALPVVLFAIAAAVVSMPLIDRLLAVWFQGDIRNRADATMQMIEAPLARALEHRNYAAVSDLLLHASRSEHVVAMVLCGSAGKVLAATPAVPRGIECDSAEEGGAARSTQVVATPFGSVQVVQFPVVTAAGAATLLLAYDLGFLERGRSTARDFMMALIAVSTVVLSLLFVGAAWWAFRRWAGALLNDMRRRRFRDDGKSAGLSLPILSQFRQVLREVEARQRLEIEYQENWTPTALQHVVQEFLESPEILIVSNREPYIHMYDAAGEARVQVPASGMVTALEPVMRACSGTWIAHGSGDADRAVVDRSDGIAVPPDSPSYRLRRVWLSKEQEDGYYFGLANEGLWPLCHLAYVRPEFREADWRQYVAVNERFAAVVAEESRGDAPVVLIQDYHFALLPELVRRRRPDATITLFWHIPWPNAETFGVCPWKRELVLGMLQADILGFHTLYHCQNFMDAVDRYVEGQIDHEHMAVTVQGHRCQIAAYPISIEWPRGEGTAPSVAACRQQIRARYAIPDGAALGIGVERWDFTKGIVERLGALRHLLETRPQLRGRVVLLQVVAPSRSRLPAYQALQERTLDAVAEINSRFGRAGWQPVVLVPEHQEPARVFELYRAADFCIVNSLHDGMNLVAKEFVAARDDEDGVLILSTFAGASRELVEALLVNPYDANETAAAIEIALHMTREERRERMRLLRRTVKHNNVFRWAGRMLVDAAQIRQRQRLAKHALARRPRAPRIRHG